MPSLSDPNIDRLIAAFGRKKYDRVPNFEILFDKKILDYLLKFDVSKKNIWNNFDISDPYEHIKIAKKTCQDAIVFDAAYKIDFREVDRKQGELDRTTRIAGSIRSEQDIENLISPNINEYRKNAKKFINAVQNTNMGVCLRVTLPMYLSYFTMGPVAIQSFMLNIFDNRKFCIKLLDFILDQQINILESLIDLEFNFIYMDDDIATTSGFFISPELINELWIPRFEKILNIVKKMQVPIVFHCCGKLDQVIPILIKYGINAINPVQPNCNDIYLLKNKYGEDICFVGNIDIGGVLSSGTPEAVILDTKEHIEKLSYNGGYVVASSHSIIDAIPPENYFAMIQTAIKFGKF